MTSERITEYEIVALGQSGCSAVLVCEGELLPSRADVDHDFTTITAYPERIAVLCTCGYHAPPVGLAENPSAHIETCGYRISMLRDIENIGQALIAD